MRDSWGVIQASSNHRRLSVGLKSLGAKYAVPFLSLLVCRQASLGDWQGEWYEAANTEVFRRGSSNFLSLFSEHALCFEDSFGIVVKRRRKYNTTSSYLLDDDRDY